MPPPRALVLGHPVAHSRSPLIHRHWLDTLGLPGHYDRQDVTPADLPGFLATLAASGYVGGNLTVPLKVAALPHMARLDPAAQAIGAVNTIWLEHGALVGDNTDAAGFIASLDEAAPGWASGRAVVLGAGGAARAAVHGLLGRGMAVAVANRTPANAAALATQFGISAHGMDAMPDLLANAGLLVNTTALGMAGQPPLTLDLAPLPASAVVADMVYVPLETPLLAAARRRRLRTVGGLGMLLHQAAPGFARWFGVLPQVTPALRALVEADLAQP